MIGISKYEILECLRVHGKLSTSRMAIILERKSSSLSSELKVLFNRGLIRKLGKEKGIRRMSIVWGLSQQAINELKKKNLRSFYELPGAEDAERLKIIACGKPFKRFF